MLVCLILLATRGIGVVAPHSRRGTGPWESGDLPKVMPLEPGVALGFEPRQAGCAVHAPNHCSGQPGRRNNTEWSQHIVGPRHFWPVLPQARLSLSLSLLRLPITGPALLSSVALHFSVSLALSVFPPLSLPHLSVLTSAFSLLCPASRSVSLSLSVILSSL